MKCSLHLALAAVLCLAACGTPGAPRPPSLELPRPVADLAATRQGDKVTLTWTVPRATTDKQSIRHPGPMRICRGVNTTAMVQCPQVAELSAAPAIAKGAKPEQGTYTDTLPADLQQQNPTGFATYALESLNARGRSAGLSNQVEVPLAPTLPPPKEISAQVTSDSVRIDTVGAEPGLPKGLSASFHLFRRQEGGQEVDIGSTCWGGASGCGPGPTPGPEPVFGPCAYTCTYVDREFEWEKTYFYHVSAITTVSISGRPPMEVMGEPSAEEKVFTKDIFPPAAPAGLQAVASGVGQPQFLDLTWAPNTEADLAGYNLYRHQAGQPPVKINAELVKAPAYRDREVTAGHNYFYAVTAVDLRGNESPQSVEASESVP